MGTGPRGGDLVDAGAIGAGVFLGHGATDAAGVSPAARSHPLESPIDVLPDEVCPAARGSRLIQALLTRIRTTSTAKRSVVPETRTRSSGRCGARRPALIRFRYPVLKLSGRRRAW